MRSVVRSLRQLRRFTQHHAEGHSQATRLFGQQNALIMCGSTSGSLSTLRCNGEISRFASPGVELMRSMFSTVVTDPIKGSLLISLLRVVISIFYFWVPFESTYFLELCCRYWKRWSNGGI
jgi:hypothetical protein